MTDCDGNEKKREEEHSVDDGLTRRRFMRNGALAAAGMAAGLSGAEALTDKQKRAIENTRSYNPDMEYRPLGDSGLWISAVCLGGHWKRINEVVPKVYNAGHWLSADLDDSEFLKNRHDIVSRCIARGINYVDACTYEEIMTYARALKGRRDKMFMGFSWYQHEMRREKYRDAEKLLNVLDEGMRRAELEYVDLWRITMHEDSSKHTKAEVDEMMKALEKAKKQGKARLIGFSSHDRGHIKWMVETYPEIDVIVTPYTADSKVVKDKSGLWEALMKNNVGWFGIKPFASNSLFKGDSSPDSEHFDEDNRRARMAIRYILCNPAITAPIPGLITPQQVDNVALAVKERRKLDKKEKAELKKAMDEAWAKLPPEYEWLKDWEYI
ncbi:MAG: aldo/keto reductase [Planctomycetota bacterium]